MISFTARPRLYGSFAPLASDSVSDYCVGKKRGKQSDKEKGRKTHRDTSVESRKPHGRTREKDCGQHSTSDLHLNAKSIRSLFSKLQDKVTAPHPDTVHHGETALGGEEEAAPTRCKAPGVSDKAKQVEDVVSFSWVEGEGARDFEEAGREGVHQTAVRFRLRSAEVEAPAAQTDPRVYFNTR